MHPRDATHPLTAVVLIAAAPTVASVRADNVTDATSLEGGPLAMVFDSSNGGTST